VEWGISLGDTDKVALRVLSIKVIIKKAIWVSCTDPVMGKMMKATEAQEVCAQQRL